MMSTKRKHKRRKKVARRGKPWKWLGLGALGLGAGLGAVATYIARRRPEGPTRGVRHQPAPTPRRVLDLAREVEVYWIHGHGGNLRVADRPATGVNGREPLHVVFVHGLGGRLEQWAPQLADEVERIHRVAFDLPGHGKSDPHSGDLTIDELSTSLAALIDSLGMRRAVLVGHSIGAAIATAYAGRHPQRVAGLLLVDPNGDPTRIPEDQRRSFLSSIRADPRPELESYYRQLLFSTDSDVADRVLASLAEVPDETLVEYVEASMAYSPSEALEAFNGPILTVVSDLNDLPHSLHRCHPELPVAMVRGSSHWLMLDDPETFAEILEDFVNGVLRTDSSS